MLTQSSTIFFRDSSNLFTVTSCWYWPTPIDLGSIFTNSARGSWSLLPMDIAPLTVTSKSGYSFVASSDAE